MKIIYTFLGLAALAVGMSLLAQVLESYFQLACMPYGLGGIRAEPKACISSTTLVA